MIVPGTFKRDFTRLTLVFVTAISGMLSSESSAEDKPDAKVAAEIQLMLDEVSQLKVSVHRNGGKDVSAELKREPILRYTDPQREFPDATLWVWTVEGRPALFSKLERCQQKTVPSWQYCLTSVNDEGLAVRWQDGIVWKSRKPALKFQNVEVKEGPQKTASLRLVQLRNIARRFRARTTDRLSNSEEMRLLAQPIFRYSSAGQSLIDGAVFGLVSNGTNPDALLMVQVRKGADESQPVWEYGCLGLSGDEITFDLDGSTVFQHGAASSPGDYGHWLWLVLPMK